MLATLLILIQAGPPLTLTCNVDVFGSDVRLSVSSPVGQPTGWSIDPGKVKVSIKCSKPDAKPSAKVFLLPAPIAKGASSKYKQLLAKVVIKPGTSKAASYEVSVDISDAVKAPTRNLRVLHASSQRFYWFQADSARMLALKRKWVGRKVWVVGAAAFTAYGSRLWEPISPAVITSVERSVLPTTSLIPPPSWPETWGPAPMWVRNPLRVKLRLPAAGVSLSPSEVSDSGPQYLPGPALPAEEGWLLVADEWHLGRMVVTRPATDVLKGESEPVLQAFMSRQVVRGMPRSLVIRLLGYPTYTRPVDEMVVEDRWAYPGPAPTQFIVEFDRAGRVLFSALEEGGAQG